MATWRFLFVLLLLLCLVLGGSLTLLDSRDGSGVEHPRFKTMLHSGGASGRGDWLIVVGWLYGALQMTFFVAVLTVGIRAGARPPKQYAPLLIVAAVGGLLLTAFTAMMACYATLLEHPVVSLWGAFPPSTAIMLYVVWPLPTVFILLYTLRFDDWILSPDDLSRFEQLARGRKDAAESDPG